MPLGRTFDLYLNAEAYRALAGRRSEVVCKLIVKLDPNNQIQEWEDNKADNVRELPVIFLPSDQESIASGRRAGTMRSDGESGPYSNSVFSSYDNKWYGDDNIRGGYNLGAELNYKTIDIGGKQFPIAGYFGSENWIRGQIYGNTLYLFDLWAKADVNIDNITGSYFSYGADIAGVRIWGNLFSLSKDTNGNIGQRVLISFGKDASSDLYKKDIKLESPSTAALTAPFLGGVPLDIQVSIAGKIGIQGTVYVAPNNKLILEVGP